MHSHIAKIERNYEEREKILRLVNFHEIFLIGHDVVTPNS